jgi:hypothetical protein
MRARQTPYSVKSGRATVLQVATRDGVRIKLELFFTSGKLVKSFNLGYGARCVDTAGNWGKHSYVTNIND